MKLKRHFALAIALILMLGLFAGCGGDTANSAPIRRTFRASLGRDALRRAG